MLDEVTLIIVELVLPHADIGRKVNLLGSPERSLSLLVRLPDFAELDRKEDELRNISMKNFDASLRPLTRLVDSASRGSSFSSQKMSPVNFA